MIDSLSSASTEIQTARVMQEAGIATLKSVIDGAKEQSRRIIDMVEQVNVITDPALGRSVDVTA